MPAETLRLRCNAEGLLTTGNKKQKAQRLFNKFNPTEIEANQTNIPTPNCLPPKLHFSDQ